MLYFVERIGRSLVRINGELDSLKKYARNMCMACAWHVHGMCRACAGHVQGMCRACALHVHCMCTACALHAQARWIRRVRDVPYYRTDFAVERSALPNLCNA